MNNFLKKYKLLLIQLLILMLCVPFCFSKNQLVISESNITLEGGPSSQYISPTFDVTPGVYKVYISKGTGTGTVFCHTNEENKLTFHALRYNALHLSESTPYAETNIYVTSKINDVYIGYETSDSTSESIGIEVYRTNIGMRILSTLLLLCFSLFDLILWFRKSIITKKSDTQQQIIVYGLSLGILTVFLPYLSDYLYLGTNSLQFYSEILAFNNQPFHNNLLFVIPYLLLSIGFPFQTAYKIFVLCILIATSVITYFSFKLCHKDKYSALSGTLVYILAPYSINMLYTEASPDIYIALLFLPLIACGIYNLFFEDTDNTNYKKYKFIIIIGLTGLFQTSIAIGITVSVLICFICLVLPHITFRKQTILQLIYAVICTFILNLYTFIIFVKTLIQNEYCLKALIIDTSKNIYHSGISTLIVILVFTIMVIKKVIYRKQSSMKNPYTSKLAGTLVLILLSVLCPLYGKYSLTVFLSSMFVTLFIPWLSLECKNATESNYAKHIKTGCLTVIILLSLLTATYITNMISTTYAPIWIYDLNSFL